MDTAEDRWRCDSVATTAAYSRAESRHSNIRFAGDDHVEFGSRPTTRQYEKDFAQNPFVGDSTTTLHDSPSSPTYPGLDGPPRDAVAPEETRSKGHTALIMVALCMAVFLAALDTTIITTALPSIAEHFQSPAGYTWIGSGYMLGAAASTPIWGKISDIFGRKPVLLVANVVFLLGSLLAGLSPNIIVLIAARVIQGIGGGGLLVLVNICIGDLFSMRSRGQYYGLVGATWAVAGAVGPLIGGAFTQAVTWRWCFYVNLPLDGVALVIIFFFLNDLHKPSTPIVAGLKAIDWLGSLLIVGGTLMLLLGLQFGGEAYPWDSVIVISLIVAGVFVVVLFFLVEWRVAPYPIIPLDIFRERSNLACLAICLCHGVTYMGGAYYLPLYFQTCLGATPILSGVYALATAIPLSITSTFTGYFIKATGKYMYPIVSGFVFMTIGYGLFINLDSNIHWAKIIIYQAIAGLGVGPLFQAPLIALQSLVPRGDIAAATATFQFVRNFATAISVVIGSVVFQNSITSKQGTLAAALGPEVASRLGGFNAGAEVGLIDSLPSEQRTVARGVFASSFQHMWIMYTAFSLAGLFISFLITRQDLSRKHESVTTGLAFEEEKRKEREDRRKSRKSLRLQSDPELAVQVKGQSERVSRPQSTSLGLSPLDTSDRVLSTKVSRPQQQQQQQQQQQPPRAAGTAKEQKHEKKRVQKEESKMMESERREAFKAEKEAKKKARRQSDLRAREAKQERAENDALRWSPENTRTGS